MAFKRSPLMEDRLADNRQRILQATRLLVAQGGFRAAQMGAVAAQAGLSTGSIYRYFPSKAELFVEVLNQAAAHEVEVLRYAVSQGSDFHDRLWRAVEAFVRRAFDGPFLAYAFIAEPADPEVDAARIAVRKSFGTVFKKLIREGIAAGAFPEQNHDISAACVVGAFTEALIGPIGPSTKGDRHREQVLRSICSFCVAAVGHNRKPNCA